LQREASEAKARLKEQGSVSGRNHSEGRPQFKHAKRVERKKIRCKEDVVVIPSRQRKRREGTEIAVSRKKGLSQK